MPDLNEGSETGFCTLCDSDVPLINGVPLCKHGRQASTPEEYDYQMAGGINYSDDVDRQ